MAGRGRIPSPAELADSLFLRGFRMRNQYKTATTMGERTRSTAITAMPGGVELHGFCGEPLLFPASMLVVSAAGVAAFIGPCCWKYGVDETAVVVGGVDGWYTFAWLAASQGIGSAQSCVVVMTRGWDTPRGCVLTSYTQSPFWRGNSALRDEEAPGGVIARGDALVAAVPEEGMAAAAAKDIPVDYQNS